MPCQTQTPFSPCTACLSRGRFSETDSLSAFSSGKSVVNYQDAWPAHLWLPVGGFSSSGATSHLNEAALVRGLHLARRLLPFKTLASGGDGGLAEPCASLQSVRLEISTKATEEQNKTRDPRHGHGKCQWILRMISYGAASSSPFSVTPRGAGERDGVGAGAGWTGRSPDGSSASNEKQRMRPRRLLIFFFLIILILNIIARRKHDRTSPGTGSGLFQGSSCVRQMFSGTSCPER